MAASFHKHARFSLGTGFLDSLQGNASYKSSFAGKAPLHRSVIGRILLLSLFVCGFVVLSGRLIYLTAVKGSYYHDLSNNNRIKHVQVAPSRGIIYARDGSVLAANRPIYQECTETGVCRYIDRDDALAQEAEGESVEVELGREYPENAAVAHLVGYMSEISDDQITSLNTQFQQSEGVSADEFCQGCYRLGDYIGAYGSEEVLESRLRGVPGKRLIEVDSEGTEIRELAHVEPQAGENITLAVDIGLQKRGIASLEKAVAKSGEGAAFVALDPKTGEVLALYSAPSFNPNLFVFSDPDEIEDFIRVADSDPQEVSFSNSLAADFFSDQTNVLDELSYTDVPLSDVLTDSRMPLFNRVINGLYPPASTFKIITSAAGLEEGVLDADTVVEDTGQITIGRFSFANWYYTSRGGTEGEIDIEQALARSNDIFFYKVGEWLGIEKLDHWAREFGLERTTGIELAGESQGMIRRDREWFLGDTYHLAIGQGDLQTTPLQVAHYTQILANDGVGCRPTILKIDADDAECNKINLSDHAMNVIHNGLLRACSPGGTAGALFDFSMNTASSSASTREFNHDGENYVALESGGTHIPMACKTGTGEFGNEEEKRTHAWLTAYAPAEDPEIVITVLVEAGGEGSSVAAPIVKDMMEEWFSKPRL